MEGISAGLHHEVREGHVGRQLQPHGVVPKSNLDGEGGVVRVARVRRGGHARR